MDISSIEIILICGLLLSMGATIFLYLQNSKLLKSFRNLTKGVSGKNLEELLREHLEHIEMNDKKINQLDKKLKNFTHSARNHFQKIGFKRFNPFHETGGDQSFCLVLLDKDYNGVIISSLHQREVTRVYAKLVKNGETKHKLSDEEKLVLNQTLRS